MMSPTRSKHPRRPAGRLHALEKSAVARLRKLRRGGSADTLRLAEQSLKTLGSERRFTTTPDGRLLSLSPGIWEFLGSEHPENESLESAGRALVAAGFPDAILPLLSTPVDGPPTIERTIRRDGVVHEWTSLPLTRGLGRAWIVSDRTALARSEVLQSALFRVSEISRDAEDLHSVLSRIHNVVGELMDASNFYVALYDDERRALNFPYYVDEADPEPPEEGNARGLTGWVLRQGEPLLATPEVFRRLVESGEIEQIGAPSVDWLGVPLASRFGTFGVMGVQSYRDDVRYSRRDLEILIFVAHHVAAIIEQRRRESALRESEQRYRQLFDNNQAIKIVIDPYSGRIVDANPAACRFYGYDRKTLCSKVIWQINTLPEHEVRQELQNAVARERGYFLFKHRTATGEIRDVEIHSGPINVGGRPLLYSIIHDVTERMRAEKALRRSEQHFRTLIENASDMVAIVDIQGTIHYNSPSVTRVLGYRASATIGKNIFDYAHPDDVDSVRTLLDDAAAGEQSRVIEMRIRHRLGGWKILEGIAHSLDEEHDRLVVNCRDISERKMAEQMLQTHAAAMEASSDGISIIDSRGRFSYVNRAFIRMFGFKRPEELVGQPWNVALDPGYTASVRSRIIRPFMSRGEWRGEIEVRAQNGSEIPSETSLYRIGNGSVVWFIHDITDRKLAAEQIRYLAYHDSLTGLANRMNFQDRLLLEISRAEREKRKLGLIYLDLDRFKSINDSKGHHFGDELLQEIGNRIRAAAPDEFLVSRLGGDEFTVLLHQIDSRDDVVRVAERILSAVREPMTILGHEVTCTTSVGVALYPEDGTDADTLKRNADKAMYYAKEQGRDRYQSFNATLGAATLERIALETGIRRARERNELSLNYQPIVSLKSGRIHGFEALLRWDSAELGRVSPAVFIPVAEALGQMTAIGAWVLDTACHDLVGLHRAGFSGISVSVNVSMTQLRHAGLTSSVLATLAESQLDAKYLELEVTESGAMENPQAIIDEMTSLQKSGVRVSLDDFGIGHSSFSHLKRLPIHTLKIDQSFIHDVVDDAETGTLVQAMIEMAHTLRLTVIAEGVETPAQRAFLTQHGCDYMQGYLFSRPMPLEDVGEFLRRHAADTRQW